MAYLRINPNFTTSPQVRQFDLTGYSNDANSAAELSFEQCIVELELDVELKDGIDPLSSRATTECLTLLDEYFTDEANGLLSRLKV